MTEKVWVECTECEGFGIDPEVENPEEYEFVFYCTRCGGSGGRWIEENRAMLLNVLLCLILVGLTLLVGG